MVKYFKEFNVNWTKIRVFLGDKDWADRSVFKECFPEANLNICEFHVLQAFNREITTTKRQINENEKTTVLAIIQDMVYAESEDKYKYLYDQLIALNHANVSDYFNSHWHCCVREWAQFGRNDNYNFLTTTSNRLESLNQKIKLVLTRYSNIVKSFKDLKTTVISLNSEKIQFY